MSEKVFCSDCEHFSWRSAQSFHSDGDMCPVPLNAFMGQYPRRQSIDPDRDVPVCEAKKYTKRESGDTWYSSYKDLEVTYFQCPKSKNLHMDCPDHEKMTE